MNQPTREEFDQLVERVTRIEQRTEEIKVTRIEVASEDVIKHLDKLDQKLDRIDQKQDEHAKTLFSHSKSVSALQNQMNEVPARFDKIESAMATKEDLTAFATKEDLATLKTAQDAHFDQIEAEQKEQHEMLHQILRLLGQKD